MHGATISISGKPGMAPDLALADSGQLLHRIRTLLAWQFGVDVGTIEAGTELVDQLYADSLDLMEMTHIMNREFDIEIAPEQLADMRTVGGVERVVAAMLPTAGDAVGQH
jgi:acyl carrier protein